jgi:hypothetical protein
MKKHSIIIAILCSFFLSSCLEILEDVKINSDGTGTYKINLNLSQSKSQLDKILAQDSIQGKTIPKPAKITSEFNKLIAELKTQAGITTVTSELDLTNYIVKLSFNFDKIESLNIAINNIIKLKDPNAPLNPITYAFTGKTFTRTLNSELMGQAARDKDKVSAFVSNLEQAKITSIMRFENNIISSNHTEAKISSNQKNCFEQVGLNQLLSNSNLYTHLITLQ